MEKTIVIGIILLCILACGKNANEVKSENTEPSDTNDKQVLDSKSAYQPVIEESGDLAGLLIDGEAINFRSGLRFNSSIDLTALQINSKRTGKGYTISGSLQQNLLFTQLVNVADQHALALEFSIATTLNQSELGAYYYFQLPGTDFHTGTINFIDQKGKPEKALVLALILRPEFPGITYSTGGLLIRTTEHKLQISTDDLRQVKIFRVPLQKAPQQNEQNYQGVDIGIEIPLTLKVSNTINLFTDQMEISANTARNKE